MKILLSLSVLIVNVSPRVVQNSERITISLGNLEEGLDDLEMITERKHRALINKKLEKFHNFVEKSKVMKHPWENLFMKETEYEKFRKSYRKLFEGSVGKLKEFSIQKPLVHFFSPPNIDKRQLSIEDNDDEDINPPQSSNSEDLKKEYEKQIMEDEEKNKAFRYSDKGKPEESINEAFQKIIDVKTPENCSNITGFGIQSIECLIKSYKSHEMTGKEAFVKFMHLFLIWIDIYLTIAIPLWCIKGWGCCCITWKYCHPRKLVKEVQQYISQNPPGVYVNKDGEEEHYAATLREKELYDKINRKILSM